MPSDSFKIALIGRTNVGKSTLFNRILGKRLALVFNRNGVTRDSKEALVEIFDKKAELIDTPGMFDYSECDQNQELMSAITRKIKEKIETSDLLLFVIDGASGITEYDREISSIVRKSGKKIIVVVNKSEKRDAKLSYAEATELGFEDIVQISAEHGVGIDNLYEKIYSNIPEMEIQQEPEDDTVKLAFVGRPNVGKSTIVNKILGQEKQLVADFAGLTRESSESDFEFQNYKVKIIDTPGIRRRAKIDDALEKISVSNTINAYRNADIVVLLIDATSLESGALEKQDLNLASSIINSGKVLVIGFNKYDKTPYKKDDVPEFLKRNFEKSLSQLKQVPFIFLSALDGTNVERLLKTAFEIFSQNKTKIKTSDLNDWLCEINQTNFLQSGASNFKLKYITQIGILPPTFVIFVSNKKNLRDDHRRFIKNNLIKSFGLQNSAIKIFFKEQEKK